MSLITARNHSIWSAHASVLTDGTTGASFQAEQLHNARIIIAWSDRTREAYFQAHVVVASAVREHYNFALVAVGRADDDTIEGLFDVWRGGTRVVTAGIGKLHGLDQTASPHHDFRLVIGDSLAYGERWQLSGRLETRFDYV